MSETEILHQEARHFPLSWLSTPGHQFPIPVNLVLMPFLQPRQVQTDRSTEPGIPQRAHPTPKSKIPCTKRGQSEQGLPSTSTGPASTKDKPDAKEEKVLDRGGVSDGSSKFYCRRQTR